VAEDASSSEDEAADPDERVEKYLASLKMPVLEDPFSDDEVAV
jgi:hypothetical protein